jgi:diacylglycerol kinase family enzyme
MSNLIDSNSRALDRCSARVVQSLPSTRGDSHRRGPVAAFISTVNASSKALGGKVSFMWGSMKALSRWRDVKVRFRVDGGAWEEASVTTLAVANGQYFGGGMRVAPSAQTDDGLFDITIWSNYSLADFIFKSAALYSGQHVKFPNTRCLKAKTLEIESDEEVLAECDGEQPGRLPCRFSVVPAAIRLRV